MVIGILQDANFVDACLGLAIIEFLPSIVILFTPVSITRRSLRWDIRINSLSEFYFLPRSPCRPNDPRLLPNASQSALACRWDR